MPAVSGLLSLGGQIGLSDQNEWVSEFQDTILVRNSRGLNAGTSLFGLMSKLRNEPAETTEYKWFERDPVTREVFIDNASTAYTSSSTSIDVDNGASTGDQVNGIVQAGSILRTSTGELLRVTAVSTGSTETTLTVTRGFGGTTASLTGLANNDTLVIVTLGKDEGSSPINPVYETPSTLVNYIQTFNSAVHLTMPSRPASSVLISKARSASVVFRLLSGLPETLSWRISLAARLQGATLLVPTAACGTLAALSRLWITLAPAPWPRN